jgi:hypothetical protein
MPKATAQQGPKVAARKKATTLRRVELRLTKEDWAVVETVMLTDPTLSITGVFRAALGSLSRQLKSHAER